MRLLESVYAEEINHLKKRKMIIFMEMIQIKTN